MELERDLEERCVDKVKARGGLALKLVILGMMGFPDRTILMPDRIIFFVEFKRRKVGKVSKQQHRWRLMLHLLGFPVYTVDNDAQFDDALRKELGQ